ncbi:MAG: hypothetical protein RI897_1242 [Verrucomicrobiota bacterium]
MTDPIPTLRGEGASRLSADELGFHHLLRSAAEPGVLLATAEGRVVHGNHAAGGMHLVGEDGLLVSELLDCLERFSAGQPGAGESVVSLNRGAVGEGQLIWVNIFPVEREGGGLLVLTLHDLRVARDLEVQTSRSQQLANLGLLSAGVAHEVKNALVAVKTYTDLLLEKQPENDSALLVRREVGRIDSLIGQLLQLAGPGQRVEAGLSLHEVLEHALRLLQPHMRDRKVEQVLVLGAKVDGVWGDSRQLQQAFLNLFFNAIEAMEGGGRLVVRTELVLATEHISKFDPGRREQQIQVEIQDSGPGIPEEEVDRSFMPFVTTKPNGTGLGLAITRKIIAEHRGRISVEGRQGEGALFRVILPLLRGS